MSTQLLINHVESCTIPGMPGRSINSARTNHWIIDEPSHGGGPNEEITPAESFLAGISACGVLLVQSAAHQAGIPLARAKATIEGVRDPAAPTDFQRIDLHFELAGPTEEQARRLVETYQAR